MIICVLLLSCVFVQLSHGLFISCDALRKPYIWDFSAFPILPTNCNLTNVDLNINCLDSEPLLCTNGKCIDGPIRSVTISGCTLSGEFLMGPSTSVVLRNTTILGRLSISYTKKVSFVDSVVINGDVTACTLIIFCYLPNSALRLMNISQLSITGLRIHLTNAAYEDTKAAYGGCLYVENTAMIADEI